MKDGLNIDDMGTKSWYLNGVLHREDGPALIYESGCKLWYLNGLIHREDGPAIEHGNLELHWLLNGIYYNEDEFNVIQLVKKLNSELSYDHQQSKKLKI
ncbi:MAG: hypothetical protein Q8T08_24305 [Ignavibacteria bacterium]|jgi:hypothetical protein|nr:hypothetical protein [Ignavibacteria bacterium]